MLADLQIFPVALFTGMVAAFMAVMIYGVLTNRDPA